MGSVTRGLQQTLKVKSKKKRKEKEQSFSIPSRLVFKLESKVVSITYIERIKCAKYLIQIIGSAYEMSSFNCKVFNYSQN